MCTSETSFGSIIASTGAPPRSSSKLDNVTCGGSVDLGQCRATAWRRLLHANATGSSGAALICGALSTGFSPSLIRAAMFACKLASTPTSASALAVPTWVASSKCVRYDRKASTKAVSATEHFATPLCAGTQPGSLTCASDICGGSSCTSKCIAGTPCERVDLSFHLATDTASPAANALYFRTQPHSSFARALSRVASNLYSGVLRWLPAPPLARYLPDPFPCWP